MNFEVRINKPKRLKFVRILSACMLVFLLWFMNLNGIREMLAQEHGYLIFYALIAAFAFVFWFACYAERRPRIVVDDLTITFYPRWGRTRTVTLSDITSRAAQIDRSDPRSAAVSAALGGGVVGYAAARALPAAPPAMVYTYFSNGQKLIRITTRDMEKVEEFDRMVVAHLDGEPVSTARVRPAAEPAGRRTDAPKTAQAEPVQSWPTAGRTGSVKYAAPKGLERRGKQ